MDTGADGAYRQPLSHGSEHKYWQSQRTTLHSLRKQLSAGIPY